MPYKDRDKARSYQREYRRIRRAGGRTTPGTSRLPASFRISTAADVVQLLSDQVHAVRSEEAAGTLEKARCIGYLAGIALKAIEAGDIAARVEAVEEVLRLRKSQS